MKISEISFKVELDDQQLPEKIIWNASDTQNLQNETKAISVNVWDHTRQNTLRIDLWVKDMRVDEMKKFAVDCIGGMAQSLLNATGDSFMANEMNSLCEKLAQHIDNEFQGK